MEQPAALRQTRRVAAGLACLVALAALPSVAGATMYRCVDPSGTPSFQDSPCPGAERDQARAPATAPQAPAPRPEVERPAPAPVYPPTPQQHADAALPRAPASIAGNTAAPPDSPRSLGQILFGAAIYFGVAALIGLWARTTNRSFWLWFILSAILNPALACVAFLFVRGYQPDTLRQARR